MVRTGCVFVAGIHPSRTMNVRIFWVRAMKCMCAQTRPRFILSSERVLGGMEFEPMLTPREKSPLLENFPRGGSNPRRCGQWAQTLPMSYSGPPVLWQMILTFTFCLWSQWPWPWLKITSVRKSKNFFTNTVEICWSDESPIHLILSDQYSRKRTRLM